MTFVENSYSASPIHTIYLFIHPDMMQPQQQQHLSAPRTSLRSLLVKAEMFTKFLIFMIGMWILLLTTADPSMVMCVVALATFTYMAYEYRRAKYMALNAQLERIERELSRQQQLTAESRRRTAAAISRQHAALVRAAPRAVRAAPRAVQDVQEVTCTEVGSCPICHENLNLGTTVSEIDCECQHCYHIHCLNQWLRLHPTCPLCRCPTRIITVQAIRRLLSALGGN